jgi:hypothetical protein
VNPFRLFGLRGAWRRVVGAHAGEVVFPTLVVRWPQSPSRLRGSVIAFVIDSTGISLRDRLDREVLLMPAAGIVSIELGPLTRSAFRPLRVTTIDHGEVDFAMSQVRPDDQVDAVVAVRTALGRRAG